MRRQGVYRPNLRYEVLTVRNEPEKRRHLVRLVRDLDGTGIIYASSVKQVDVLHQLLNYVGFMAARIHRRMSTAAQKAEVARFCADRVQAIVATSTFVPPAEKSDVRFVIHCALPETLDAYYAESIRAGADGLRARSVLLYHRTAARAQDTFKAGRAPDLDIVTGLYAALRRMGGAARAVPRVDVRAALGPVTRESFRDALVVLKALDVVTEQRGLKLRLRHPERDAAALRALATARGIGRSGPDQARRALIAYAETRECRWRFLLRYFGEAVEWDRCGKCDNCRYRKNRQTHLQTERSVAAEAPAHVDRNATPRRRRSG